MWEIGSGYFGCRTEDGHFDPERFAENLLAEAPAVELFRQRAEAITGGALGPVMHALPHEMLIIGGAGGVLSQPVPDAQSRTYCLSKLGWPRPGS